jgi:glucose/arabinose dehydrogenase
MLLSGLAADRLAFAQFSLIGPGVAASEFRVTTFAAGLNFPVGMTELPDGSLLVAVSNGSGAFSTTTSGSLVRVVDTDFDGVANLMQTLVGNVPGGRLTSVRRAGDLIAVTGQGPTNPISFYRLGALASDPLVYAGQLNLSYPSAWSHMHTSLLFREAPGTPDQYELYFQIGSRNNNSATTQTVNVTGTPGFGAVLSGDAIHRIKISDNGTSIVATQHTRIATGLRNASGMIFHPHTGDFYIGENGIDGLVDPNEPYSADELNVIPAAQLGNSVPDFGFPNTYEQYRTGTQIGTSGVLPIETFQPIPMPNGSESEGISEIVFAPSSFPPAFQGGLFAGFHGRFSLGGIANEENPVVFVNLATGTYFHIVGNQEPAVGHPDGFVATRDTLYISDMSPTGALGAAQANTGQIYAVRSLVPKLAGDYNADGNVDAADYVIWREFNNTSATLANDATIGTSLTDYEIWRANFGQISADGSDTVDGAAAPEPAAIVLLLIATTLGTLRLRFF